MLCSCYVVKMYDLTCSGQQPFEKEIILMFNMMALRFRSYFLCVMD